MLQYLINGLVEGAIYALIALGYTMVYGILGMINFAHGEIYMLGAYAGILAIGAMMSVGLVAASLPLAILLAFCFGIVVCALWGATMEKVAYRPLREAPSLAPLISAIGASFFILNLVMVCQGKLKKSLTNDVREWLVTRVMISDDVGIMYLEIGILVTSILMMVGLQLFIHRSRLGKAMRATAQDRTMASLVGIPINRVITATFVIGSGLAAVAGIMFALYASAFGYTDGYLPGMKAFTAAVLGGIGNVPGAMLGGFVLGIAENLGIYWFSADYKDVYAFVILMLVLIFRPRGILGERVADKV